MVDRLNTFRASTVAELKLFLQSWESFIESPFAESWVPNIVTLLLKELSNILEPWVT